MFRRLKQGSTSSTRRRTWGGIFWGDSIYDSRVDGQSQQTEVSHDGAKPPGMATQVVRFISKLKTWSAPR
jgi:hypothetical protein